MKDIQVYTALDAKVKPAERLDILVLSTEGKADMQTFNDLELLKEAYRGKKVAARKGWCSAPLQHPKTQA